MRNYKFIIICLITLFFSCEDCPDGIKRNDIKLSENSIEYISNNIENRVIFKDLNNNIIVFSTTGLTTNIHTKVTDSPCSQALVSATYNYVEQETKEITFENNNNSISINLNLFFVEYYEIENPVVIDTNFVEAIELYKHNKLDNADNSGLSLITDLRGKTLTNDIEYNNSFIFYESIIIIDSVFTNVYADINNKIFYNKDKGIIGFSNNGIKYRYKYSN